MASIPGHGLVGKITVAGALTGPVDARLARGPNDTAAAGFLK